MIRLIIFDIGGVLEDFNEDMYINYICPKLQLNKKRFSASLKSKLMLAEEGKLGTWEMLSEIASEFSVKINDLEWQYAILKLAKMNKDTVKLANRLSKKYDLVLLTNVSRSRYISNINNGMLKGIRYKRIFASCFMGVAKPKREAYLQVIRSMNVKPEEAVFIDDRMENVKGGRVAGLHGIHYTTCADLSKSLNKLGVDA